jgi:methylthioxylose transferase
MIGRRTAIGFALVAAGSLAVLWLSNLPLGVPGEWEWDRIPFAREEWTAVILGCFLPGLIGSLYIALTLIGARRLEAAPRWQIAAWLVALTVGGFAWLWAVQDSPARPEYRMTKTAWALYFPGPEGYFDQARYEMRDVPSYLAGYEKLMAEGDVLHLGTHPPGLMLFHRACLNLCANVPVIRDLLLATQPATFKQALDTTEEVNRERPNAIRPNQITENDRAALWLAALITQVLAAAALIPIYLLIRRDFPRPVAWLSAAIWPLVPALAVFLPKSDALLPVLGVLFLWLWLEGFRRGRLGLCFLAGATFWLAMFLSLAILPIGAAAALLTFWEAVICAPDERLSIRPRDWVARIGAAGLGWGIPVVALGVLFKLNLLGVWRLNYHNHAGFYQHYVRTYWRWLCANPIELVFALGAPLALAAVLGVRFQLKRGWRRRAAGPAWCLTAVWLLLWLSGKNMGEAARLWLIMMPWAVCLAAGYFAAGHEPTQAGDSRLLNRAALWLLALEMLVCLGTVLRVTGFRWT